MTPPLLAPVVLVRDVNAFDPGGDDITLRAGQVGTVVHILGTGDRVRLPDGQGATVIGSGVMEVEFCDIEGRTLALKSFAQGDDSLLPLRGMGPTHPPPWLLKDFLALYQAARALDAALYEQAKADADAMGPSVATLAGYLKGQLERLAPTFQLCEQVRRGQPESAQLDPAQLCTLGGGGPVCLPCADRITREIDETEGPKP
jgi:hypothetical protein